MADAAHDLARRLHQVLEKQSEPAGLDQCSDLVERLAEEARNMTRSSKDAQALVKCLSSVSKSLRLRKRSDPSWAPMLSRVTGIVEKLQHHRTVSSTQVADKSSASSSTAAASRSTKDGASAHGLPKTVHEYHDRLKLQKKEIYKNPPVLPPHSVRIESKYAATPNRSTQRVLCFEHGLEADAPTQEFIHKFRPNVTPEEVLRGGAFGGTYFRPIASAVTNVQYNSKDVLKATVLPEWIEGLDVKLQLTSNTYRNHVNRYGVKCGGSLGMWESSGWISDADPYGWFQWYCRFYRGRRSSDDSRQISRWLGVAGPTGRFRTQLCNKILASSRQVEAWNDASVSPVIRQTLVHWGLEITRDIVEQQQKKRKR